MPQEIAQLRHHPVGECKFTAQFTTSASPCSPSELCELDDEIKPQSLELFHRCEIKYGINSF